MRSTVGCSSPLGETALDHEPLSANLTQLTAGTDLLGMVQRVGNVRRFRVFQAANNALAPVATIDSVPGDQWLSGRFTGGPLSHFFFFARGESTLFVHAATGPASFGLPKAYGRLWPG